MFKEIMIYIYVLLLVALMWYPGFLLAYNMTVACSGTKPSIGGVLLCCIPFINLGVARKQVYGSAKLVWGVLIAVVVLLVMKFAFYFGFNTSLGVLISMIVTYAFFAGLVVFWLMQCYVLIDMSNVIGTGMVSKVCAFIMPPLSSWIIGHECIPKMKESLAALSKERVVEDDYY